MGDDVRELGRIVAKGQGELGNQDFGIKLALSLLAHRFDLGWNQSTKLLEEVTERYGCEF